MKWFEACCALPAIILDETIDTGRRIVIAFKEELSGKDIDDEEQRFEETNSRNIV